jgi:hypothetical protein
MVTWPIGSLSALRVAAMVDLLIFIALWLIAVFSSLDLASLRREVLIAGGGLPVRSNGSNRSRCHCGSAPTVCIPTGRLESHACEWANWRRVGGLVAGVFALSSRGLARSELRRYRLLRG